jgi:hypothetical protein
MPFLKGFAIKAHGYFRANASKSRCLIFAPWQCHREESRNSNKIFIPPFCKDATGRRQSEGNVGQGNEKVSFPLFP